MNEQIEKRINSIRTKDELLSAELYEEWDELTDEIEKIRLKELIRDKARGYKCTRAVDAIFKSIGNMKRNFDNSTGDLPEYITMNIGAGGAVKYTVNAAKLAQYIRAKCNYRLVRNDLTGSTKIIWYSDGVYKWLNETELQGYVKVFIEKFDRSITRMKDVIEAVQQLRTDIDAINEDVLNLDENIINFQNGLLRLSDCQLIPHTPELLSTIQIPCNYNPVSKSAPVFSAFLDELAGGDASVKRFLLQWLGVAISNISGTRFKKALFMYGKGDTGKSQLLRLAQLLLGPRNYSTVDLSDLEKRFGTSYLYMKRLSGCGDMSFVAIPELKIFKQLTGGEAVFAERKGQDGFNFVYNGLLWYCMNELPRFGGDRGQWVYDRIITLQCNNVIPVERQDKQLLQKMYAEREAIVNMVIPELLRVIRNGYRFDVPKTCDNIKTEYVDANSPIRQFYKECCVMRGTGHIKNDSCTTGTMYNVFKAWYADNYGQRVIIPSNQKFKKELAEICAENNIRQIETRTNSGRYYIFTLNLETKRLYRREYGSDSISDI